VDLSNSLTGLGTLLIVTGLGLFVKKPKGMGGKTTLKLGKFEANLPVASLVPMVLGAILLLGAIQLSAPSAAALSAEPQKAAKTAPGPAPEMQCVPATSVKLATLIWAPADCPQDPTPSVRIDTCAEHRQLPWLQRQMASLRSAKVEGFANLPEAFELIPGEYNGQKDWVLKVRMNDGTEPYNVGVGYNILSGAKDGCLSLVQHGQLVSAFACMDKSGHWWIERGTQLCSVEGN
jgi:hypothetical protein